MGRSHPIANSNMTNFKDSPKINEKVLKGSYRLLENDAVNPPNTYVMALDIGTTNMLCHVYDKSFNIMGLASRKIKLLHPAQGQVEIDPETLWAQVQQVIKETITNTGLAASSVACLGLTVQRNTFITWHRDTGEPFHHFITWQDLRASSMVKSWNESYTMKAFTTGTKAMHTLTRRRRFLAASVLRFKSGQVTMRLKWMLENNKEMKEEAEKGNVRFGTIDTWLLWKLTHGESYATDFSNASTTGIFDPFNMEWSPIVCNLVGIPISIFPPIMDTSSVFGACAVDLFGSPIPITALVADQQAAMFGQGCFNVGDINLTMGTGTFIDCNTGTKPHASATGLYPIIGWKIGPEIVFVAEGMASDTGRCIEWIQELGLFQDVASTSDIAQSVPDSGGAYFVPAFSGLQTPMNDDKACTSLVGITPQTTRAHVVRAVLEALAFRVKLLYDTILHETRTPLQNNMRIDGGVANNDFLMTLIADLLGVTLDRPKVIEMTSFGAAFLAGLAIGVWKSKDELLLLRKMAKVFTPSSKRATKYKPVMAEWERAVSRTLDWYKSTPV